MSERIQKDRRVAIRYGILWGLLLAMPLVPAGTVCAAKRAVDTSGTESPIRKLENAIVSAGTKKIRYCSGTVTDPKARVWKKAARLSLSAASLKIRKKGWYTFRIAKKSGKYKLITVRLKRMTYSITVNTPQKQKSGYYYLSPKSNTAQGLGIKDSSLSKGEVVSLEKRGSTAGGVWLLEMAGGTRFRLKNANSGLYLTGRATKQNRSDSDLAGTAFSQRKYNAKNTGQVFRCYPAGGRNYYIKNLLTKQYLNLSGSSLTGAARKNDKAWKFRFFSVDGPVSRAVVKNETAPVSLLYGKAFSLRGMVTSFYTIKTLTARIVDARGAACIQKTVEPGTCQYDLAGVDAAIPFGRLAVGKYLYQVIIRDSAGKTMTVLNREFVVYVPGGTTAKTLIYNPDRIAAVGHQSTGSEQEKKACASYALAYCNAILTGAVVSPHTYWSSNTNVDCVWSRGGYTTSAYHSEQEVLQAAYGQLTAGRPCILHVTGKTGNQHWVTLIGYKNVVNAGKLSAVNFVALDPWNGEFITVTDSYQVRTTFRLAYKNG